MNIEREELTRIILEEIVCVKTNILESLMLSEKRRRNKNSARDQLKKDKDNLKNKVAERERTIRLRDRTIEELKDEIQNLNLKIRDREKAFEEYVDSEEKDLMRKINKVVSKLPTDQIRKRNKKVDQDFKKMEDLIDPERRSLQETILEILAIVLPEKYPKTYMPEMQTPIEKTSNLYKPE